MRRSLRAKRMRLLVRGGGIELVVPKRANRAVAEEFLRSAAGWIGGQTLKLQLNFQQIERGVVWYRGERFRIVLDMDRETKGVAELRSGTALVTAFTLEEAESVLVQSLRGEARRIFEARVSFFAEVMGVAPARVRIGDQRSRWGSCSARGTISLNWRLVMAPAEVLDYIVVHELAHLREMNHSRRFWEIVESFYPSYREQEVWLKENGFRLMSFGKGAAAGVFAPAAVD